MIKLVQTGNKHLTYISYKSREWKILNDNNYELFYDGHLWEIRAVAFIHDYEVFVDIKNKETKKMWTKIFLHKEAEVFKVLLEEND